MRLSALLIMAVCAATVWGAVHPVPVVADVSRDVRLLPLRRAILLPDSLRSSGRWVEIREDSILAAGAATDLDDLRVVDALGQVVPAFIGYPNPWIGELEPLRSEPITWDVDEEGDLSFTLELDEAERGAASGGTQLALGLAGTADFIQSPLQGSPDGTRWRVVKTWYLGTLDRSLEHSSPGLARISGADLADLRFVRLHPRSTERPPVDASLTLYERVTSELPTDPVSYHIESSFNGRRWRAMLELDGAERALTSLEVATGHTGAHRAIVEARDRHGNWLRIRQREHAADDDPGDAGANRLAWAPQRTSALRFTVEGADPPNPPFEPRTLRALPAHITFRVPEEHADVWIAYGDAHLEQSNTLRLTQAPGEHGHTPRAELGLEEPNTFYQAPGFGLEWLRRHPGVLTATMFLVLAALGLLVWRWGATARKA